MNTITVSDYKNIKPIKSIADIRAIFPIGGEDDANWLFLSTSGTNGTYATLDDIENGESNEITVLIVQPRLVCIYQGHIEIKKEDVPYLRNLVTSTLNAVADSQAGNQKKKEPQQ